MLRKSDLTPLLAFAALLLLILATGARAQQPHIPGVVWSGESDGISVTWSGTDLTARKGDALLFSARAFAKQGRTHFVSVMKDPKTGDVPRCVYERRFRLVSLVGTLMSFRDQYYSSCAKEAHPGGESRLTTIDLAKQDAAAYGGPDSFGEVSRDRPGKVVRLTDLFGEQDIFNQLIGQKLIRQTLEVGTGKAPPQNLPELMKRLSGLNGRAPDCFSIPADLLTRFAFYQVANGQVEVKLGLPGDGPCRDDLTLLSLQFPIPGKLEAPLAKAMEGTTGILMKDTDQLGEKKETEIRFHTGAAPRKPS